MSSSSAAGLVAVAATLAGLSTLFVGLRFYVRRVQKLRVGPDDWIMIPAVVSYIGAATCCFIAVHDHVLGYSTNDLTPEEWAAKDEEAQKLAVGTALILNFTLAFTKMSILLFYRRVFCVGHRFMWFSLATNITLVVVGLWLITFSLLGGLQCGTHWSALWDGTYLEYCTISFAELYGLAISDFLLDIWILVMPIPIIAQLHMTPSKKLSVIGLFLLAFIGLGASIARMVIYIYTETGGDPGLFADLERAETMSTYYSMLEAGMSALAANLPSLWLFFISLVPERIVNSVRSILSLESMRGSRERVGSVAAESTSNVHLSRKPNTSSSFGGSHADMPSDLSTLREQVEKNAQTSNYRSEAV